MNWTNPESPKEGISYYDHVIAETPIGSAIIEWKSWKDNPSFDLQVGNDWIGCEYSLDAAKELARIYLKTKYEELGRMLSLV